MTGEYKLNKLLRDIIEKDFNNNQSEFARFMKTTKQEIYRLYNNKFPLSYKRFRVIAEKCGYLVNISIEKNCPL